jgi:hypothetical protein
MRFQEALSELLGFSAATEPTQDTGPMGTGPGDWGCIPRPKG